MSATIIDVLGASERNFENASVCTGRVERVILCIVAMDQLRNCRILLEKGYPITFEMNDVLDAFPDITKAPSYTEWLESL